MIENLNLSDTLFRILKRLVVVTVMLAVAGVEVCSAEVDMELARASLFGADGTGGPWTKADQALWEAMQSDTNVSWRGRQYYPQAEAISAWMEYLKRDDLTANHKLFAWWRIGSLYGYNFDRAKGERADLGAAIAAFEKAVENDTGIISFELMNSWSQLGSYIGSMEASTKRVSRSYKWFASITEEQIRKSSLEVAGNASILPPEFIVGSAGRRMAGREELLVRLVKDHLADIEKQLDDKIIYASTMDDFLVLTWLVKDLEGTARPELITRWRTAISSRLQSNKVLSETIRNIDLFAVESSSPVGPDAARETPRHSLSEETISPEQNQRNAENPVRQPEAVDRIKLLLVISNIILLTAVIIFWRRSRHSNKA